jgi:hypothetical protein
MKKILTFATLTLYFLIWVAAVNATPITEGNQSTWRFELDSSESQSFDAVGYYLNFTYGSGGDQFDVGETMEIRWMDDIGDTPLVSRSITQSSQTSGITTQDVFGAAWEADEDIFMEVGMITGSVEVREGYPEIYVLYYNHDNNSYVNVNLQGIPVTSVPDASIMLLLGSSLMGLAVFSKKPKKG